MIVKIKGWIEFILSKVGIISAEVEHYISMALQATTELANWKPGADTQGLLDKIMGFVPEALRTQFQTALGKAIDLLTKSDAILTAPTLAGKLELFLTSLEQETGLGRNKKLMAVAQEAVRALDGARLLHSFYDHVVQTYFTHQKVLDTPATT